MNIRFLLAFILCLNSVYELRAQAARGKGAENFSWFNNTTTLIVLDDTISAYNIKVEDAIRKYWDITPVKFISRSELDDYLGTKNFSMLLRNNSERTIRRVRQNLTIRNNEIGLYLCYRHVLTDYLPADAITYIKVKDVDAYSDYLYKLEGLIQTMQDYLKNFLDKRKITRDNIDQEEEQFFNQYRWRLKEVNLFIRAEDLPEGIDKDNIQKYYRHNVSVVTPEEIEQAIASQEMGVAYLHVYPRAKQIQIISAKGGQVLYSAPAITYGEFHRRDLSRISKAVNKSIELED